MPRRTKLKKVTHAAGKPAVRKARGRKGEPHAAELVIITGMSGSGKASALKAFEDLGYYSVDNLPLDLIPRFADLVRQSTEIDRAALVVFLEASEDALVRLFSETRRPHPMDRVERRGETVLQSIQAERKRLDPIRNVADIVLDTTRFNVHELRAHINAQCQRGENERNLMIASTSFGFKNGVPSEADLVFDVRFLPNPPFVPEFRHLTGRHPKVAKYVREFPQTQEFLDKTADLLTFLLPHYIKEGKSYLTVAFGCTGGQHRWFLTGEEMKSGWRQRGIARRPRTA